MNLESQEGVNNLIPHIIHMGRTLLSASINLVLNTLCIYPSISIYPRSFGAILNEAVVYVSFVCYFPTLSFFFLGEKQ